MAHEDFEVQRRTMVERQLRRRGIGDERVLEAMGAVPRELFMPEATREAAYADGALAIGYGQTISQPWIVAAIAQALTLRGDERLLEIGTGSGYSAAVLARLAAEVVTIENVEPLALDARERLEALGLTNVITRIGDGTEGASDLAPFDAIAVHAAAAQTPAPLLGQLARGGRMVIPLKRGHTDELTLLTRIGEEEGEAGVGGLEATMIAPTRFVPLVSDRTSTSSE